jgi:hypothetical protein
MLIGRDVTRIEMPVPIRHARVVGSIGLCPRSARCESGNEPQSRNQFLHGFLPVDHAPCARNRRETSTGSAFCEIRIAPQRQLPAHTLRVMVRPGRCRRVRCVAPPWHRQRDDDVRVRSPKPDGDDLRGLSPADRKKRLARLPGRRRLGIVLSDHAAEDGALLFVHLRRMGHEGIVSKRLSAPYRSGRSTSG